jgi:hypothetical protein
MRRDTCAPIVDIINMSLQSEALDSTTRSGTEERVRATNNGVSLALSRVCVRRFSLANNQTKAPRVCASQARESMHHDNLDIYQSMSIS